MLGQLGAAPEEQLACFEAALAIDPLDANAHYNQGEILGQLGAAPQDAARREVGALGQPANWRSSSCPPPAA